MSGYSFTIRKWYLVQSIVLMVLIISPVFQRNGSVITDGWMYVLVILNVSAFVAFGWDKIAAASDTSRIPENVLLVLVGGLGAIGGLLSQSVFNHKVSKKAFVIKNLFASLVSALWYLYLLEML